MHSPLVQFSLFQFNNIHFIFHLICRHITLTLVLPLYNALIDHCEDTSNNKNVSALLMDSANAAKEKLLEYYNKTDATSSYVIAIVMDPQQKLDYCKRNRWGPSLIASIKTK